MYNITVVFFILLTCLPACMYISYLAMQAKKSCYVIVNDVLILNTLIYQKEAKQKHIEYPHI